MQISSVGSARFVVNVAGAVLLGNYEPRTDMADNRHTGEHQSLSLGHTRGAAHLSALSALSEAASRDCLLDLPGV